MTTVTVPTTHTLDVDGATLTYDVREADFAGSGGAVNALALVASHPEDVRKLVAHEPAAGVDPA